MTVAWSIGISTFIPAGNAQAVNVPPQSVQAGSLVKLADGPAVWSLDDDMHRFYHPFNWVYGTWYPNYDEIQTLPAGTDMDAYFQPGGAVFARPGSCEAMKSVVSPAVYVMSYGGVRHKFASEAAAIALCGATWAQHVHDLPDFVISLAPIGGEYDGLSPMPGSLIRSESDGPVYVVGEDLKAYAVEGSLPAFLSKDVRLVSQAQWDALVGMGEGTRTVASLTANPAQKSTDSNNDNDNDNTSTSTSTGDLKISLAGNTAEADVVPGGAQNVEYISVVVQAVGGDVDLDSLTFRRSGVGSNDDFNKIYLYHDGVRLENGRTLNNDDEVTFNVNLSIKSGDSETLVLKADMELIATAEPGDQNRFEIRSKDDIEASGADISGSFPVRGNLLVVGSQDIGTVTITKGGTSTNVKIGQDDVKVGEFDVEASGDDVTVTSVVLQQKGSIDTSALSNFVLKQGGNTVATGEVVGDDKVRFDFETAKSINDGDSVTYRVYADVGIADTNDTIKMILDEDSDFSAFSENNTGFEVGVTNTDLNSGNAMTLTVEGGKINVDFDGESNDVRQDENDASFGTFTILATAEDLDVNQMDFVLHKNANTYTLEDMKIRDKNGHGTYSLTAPSTIGLAQTSSTVRVEDLTLEKGVAYEFEILGDINNTATSGSSYNFTWAAASVDATGVSSDNDVSANDFSSAALSGPSIDVDISSLTARTSALSDDSVVNGKKNVLLYRGTLEAGKTSDINITSMTFGDAAASDPWDGLLDGVKLFIAPLNTTIDPTTATPDSTDNTVNGEEAIFDGIDVIVKSGSANRVKFEVYGDVTDGTTAGDVSLELQDIDASDVDDEDVTPKDSNGATITGLESDRVITVTTAGTLSMVVDNDYTDFKATEGRYALAGTEKFLAGRVKLQADLENVEVRDLTIAFSTTSPTAAFSFDRLDASIDTISIYSDPSMADSKLLGTADFAATTTIQDLALADGSNYTVTDGQTAYLYIGLKLNSVGTDSDGTAVPSTSFKINVASTGQDVRGADSTDDITPAITGTKTNDINVNPVKITNVSSDFAGGSLVGGNQNIFSFKVTADAGRNTDEDGEDLNAHLITLKLDLSTDVATASASNTSAWELCRVDSGNCITLTTATSTLLSNVTTTAHLVSVGSSSVITLADFSDNDDEYVDNGETVEFIVKATMANVTDKFAQVKLLDLDSSGLSYGVDTDNDNTDDYIFTDMRKDAPRGTDYPNVTGKALN